MPGVWRTRPRDNETLHNLRWSRFAEWSFVPRVWSLLMKREPNAFFIALKEESCIFCEKWTVRYWKLICEMIKSRWCGSLTNFIIKLSKLMKKVFNVEFRKSMRLIFLEIDFFSTYFIINYSKWCLFFNDSDD